MAERRPRIEDLIKEVDILQVLEWLNVHPPDRSHKIPCLIHPDQTPSMHIYRDGWFCYGCGQGGDIVNLVSAVLKCSTGEAIDWIAARHGGHYAPTPRIVQTRKELMDFGPELLEKAGIWYSKGVQRLIDARWPGLFTPDRLHDFGCLTSNTSLLIPHRDNLGVIRGVKTRQLYNSDKTGPIGTKRAWSGSVFSKRLYTVPTKGWPPHLPKPYAAICEGESDTWALAQEYEKGSSPVDVYGLPSGAAVWKAEWVVTHRLHRYNLILVMTDQDEAGSLAARAIQAACPKAAKVLLREKDVCDSVRAGWRPPLS